MLFCLTWSCVNPFPAGSGALLWLHMVTALTGAHCQKATRSCSVFMSRWPIRSKPCIQIANDSGSWQGLRGRSQISHLLPSNSTPKKQLGFTTCAAQIVIYLVWTNELWELVLELAVNWAQPLCIICAVGCVKHSCTTSISCLHKFPDWTDQQCHWNSSMPNFTYPQFQYETSPCGTCDSMRHCYWK